MLFGAGQGTTLGSFGGRVESFLATLAPDIGKATDDAFVCGQTPVRKESASMDAPLAETNDGWTAPEPQLAGMWASVGDRQSSSMRSALQKSTAQKSTADSPLPADAAANWQPAPDENWFEKTKTTLAAVGLLTLSMLLLKAVC